jgi:hypothetical protein
MTIFHECAVESFKSLLSMRTTEAKDAQLASSGN